MDVQLWGWLGFGVFVLAMFVVDFAVFGGRAGKGSISLRRAVYWSIGWTALGLLFAGFIFFWKGSTLAGEYLGGFLIEKSLSVDNLFVFALIFSYFAVPPTLQKRVLFWGILGALLLRGVMILAGSALLDTFAVTLYVFGAFLIFTGIRMATHKGVEIHPERNPVLRLMGRIVPISSEYHGNRFFVRENARRIGTPLLGALVLVASLDVVFAVDSIPAIFGVTEEIFIVFAANAFSLLGLSALYFVLAGMLDRFQYLNLGLSAVLVFIGAKMVLTDVVHLPTWLSLAVVIGILAATVIISVVRRPTETPAESDDGPAEVEPAPSLK